MGALDASFAAWQRAWGVPAIECTRMVETETFGPNPGNLRMLSLVPDDMNRGAPLVVVLHGCTQTAEAHASSAGWLALAPQCGFAVLAPEQRTSNNSRRCFNWFEPADITRDSGEIASVRAMIADMISSHALDADRIFITGLSAGGAMASVMLASYPEVFAGGAIIAGLPYDAADSMQTALRAMRGGSSTYGEQLSAARIKPRSGARIPRVTVWHGDEDHTVNAVNAELIARQWTRAHSLSFEAGQSEILDRRSRTVWRVPATGEVVVETNIVRGLGHGTPLATRGENSLGAVAPYMLEADLSAVIEVADFWGLQRAQGLGEQASLTDSTIASPIPRVASELGTALPGGQAGRVS